MSEKKVKKLTDRQKVTACHYIKKWNLVKSMIKAGYSENYARKQGYKLLDNVGFNDYVAKIQNNIEKQAGISKLSQILELKKIAYGNIADLFADWDKLKDFNDLTKDQKAVLAEISYKKDIKYISGIPTDIKTEFVKLKGLSKIEAIKEIDKILGYHSAENTVINIKNEILGFMPGGFEEEKP